MSHSATDQKSVPVSSPHIQRDEVLQMANDLFSSMLGMSFEPANSDTTAASGGRISASILIEGDWNAEMRVVVPNPLANEITETMFGLDAGEASEAEILDAIGEVVNVLGGNAKGVINGECSLSLPCVGSFDFEGPNPDLAVTFNCNGQRASVLLFEKK